MAGGAVPGVFLRILGVGGEGKCRQCREDQDGQQQSLELTQDRRRAGLVGDLDVRQAELNLARTESLLPQLYEGLAASVHRLAVLTGRLPSAISTCP